MIPIKKVEVRVNGAKQTITAKLGKGLELELSEINAALDHALDAFINFAIKINAARQKQTKTKGAKNEQVFKN